MGDHHLLSLSRAAHLLGVTRASLQALIRDGTLQSFDGQVALSDLQNRFPAARFDDAGAFEKVLQIKEQAFGRRVRERALPSQEVLAQRIFQLGEELEDVRRHLQQYHTLVQGLLRRLEAEPGLPRETLRREIESGLGQILASESDTTAAAVENVLKVVAAQVTVRPSGHQFLVEGNDTLLQSGLKAGLRLNYGCGSGSCGLCKTRVVSGEVRQIGHADYHLSEAEKASGHILSCVCTPVSDVVIETLEALGPQDIPEQDIGATVRAIQPTTAGGPTLLHVQTPRSNRLRFLAGQGVTLGLRTAAGDIASSWPIASCPCDDRNLCFHIPAGDDDPLARALAAGLIKVGEKLSLRGPFGDFTLDPESTRPLVFLCQDTGFGPVKSLIEHAMAIDSVDTFGVVWIADAAAGGHYLDNQCRMWADAYDHFDYRALRSAGLSGDAAAVLAEAQAALPYLRAADVYVAGRADFVGPLAAALLADVPRLRQTVL